MRSRMTPAASWGSQAAAAAEGQDLENDGEWLAFWVMIALTVAVLIFGGMFF